MGYIFEWDREKSRTNQRKHGVEFVEAATVFADPRGISIFDPDHSIAEDRWLLLGRSERGRILVVSYTERPPRTRIISARSATRLERSQYAQL
jgi:hypothetical protein